MRTLSVLTWIGNAAAVLCGRHGSVTAQTQQASCSRQAAYEHAAKVTQAVEEAHLPGPTRAQLLAENQRLRQQLAQLQQHAADAIDLSKERQKQLATKASALGLSYTQTEELLAVLLPANRVPDHATIGRWVGQAARRAALLLRVLDQASQPYARTLCLDEIFFHGRPVLVAVEPASMAVLLCQRAANRQGQTWKEALLPFTHLEAVVRDAGSGLSAGVTLLNEHRHQTQSGPPLEDGLDVFHTEQEAQRWLNRLWRRVEKRWFLAEAADQKVVQAKQRQKDARGPAVRARTAWRRAFETFGWYEQQAALWRRAKTALELFRPDGRLNDRAWAAAELTAVCQKIRGLPWQKVRSFLQDGRTLTFLERMQRRLGEAEPRAAVREALVELWRLEHRAVPGGRVLSGVQRVICAHLTEDWEAAYQRVSQVLGSVVRASSAVECVNSVLRMQQARHRTVTQPMLDLKRLYWNCRAFHSGRRRDRCPYQHLGVVLPTYDFWELLHQDPQKLAQELSTHALAV
jgi:hypothetical protein